MAILGININKENPEFTIEDFKLWMPQFKTFMNTEEGILYFNKLYKICNAKIFYSIYGTDWEYAMCLAIAHYLTLISNQLGAPSGSSLVEIAGGGTYKGVLQSATIGGFSKSYDLDKTMSQKEESLFWNQTSYGAALMALLASKPIASIMVVTSGPINKKVQ